MSYIPGTGSVEANIASQNGSGITISNSAGTDYLSANLVAGNNISLVPSLVDSSITINASPGGVGIASVTSASGAGVNAITNGTAVTLFSSLIGGTGIGLTGGGMNPNIVITNTQSQQSATGSGIAITTNGGTNNYALNLVAGSGIVLQPSGINTSQTISVGNLAQTFLNLQPGQIPQIAISGSNTPQTGACPFPVLGGSINIPTIAGGVYCLQGLLSVIVGDNNTWGIKIFLNNGVNDLVMFQGTANQFYNGIYTNGNIGFNQTFYATGSSVQIYMTIGANASSAVASFAPITIQRLV